jgi:hypothetical protein
LFLGLKNQESTVIKTVEGGFMSSFKDSIAREQAKLTLTYWGLVHARIKHPTPVHRWTLLAADDPKKMETAPMRSILRNKDWMKGYLERMVSAGVLQTENGVDYSIASLEKLDSLIADQETLGREKLAWFLSPKESPYPWGKEALEASAEKPAKETTSEEISEDHLATPKMEVRAISITPENYTDLLRSSISSILEHNRDLCIAVKKLIDNSKATGHDNSSTEELKKAINKLNRIETKQASLEQLLQAKLSEPSTYKSDKLEQELARLTERLVALESSVAYMSSATTHIVERIEEVIASAQQATKREVDFIYTYLSDALKGIEGADNAGSSESAK